MKKYLMIGAMLLTLSAQALAYTYPAAVTAGIRRSMLNGGVKPATAGCVIAKVQQQFSFDEFTDEVTLNGGDLSPAMRRLVLACVIETQ